MILIFIRKLYIDHVLVARSVGDSFRAVHPSGSGLFIMPFSEGLMYRDRCILASLLVSTDMMEVELL